MATPQRFYAAAISGSEVSLTWQNYSHLGATGFLIESSLAGGAWTTVATADPGSSGYLATGLTSGGSYAFRVTTLGTTGNPNSAPAATASPVVLPASTAGLYRVILSSHSLLKGSSGYSASGSIYIVPALLDATDTSGMTSVWFAAASWQDAIRNAVSGSATVTRPDGSTEYDFGPGQQGWSGAFRVGTPSNFPGLPSGGGDVITLEDSFDTTNVDVDYNDDYFALNAIQST